LAAALLATTVACGVVDDGKVQRINPGALDDTLPSTTESTTTTTEAVTTTTGLETTTTDVQTEPVKLYYIVSGLLNSVPNQLPSQFALTQLVALLQHGPPEGDLGRGLRNALPDAETAEITVTADGAGVAQVVLPDGFFDSIVVGDQRLAVGQVVMTLLDSRGIGQVVFNQQVSGPAGEVIPAGQLITRLDYQSLLASATTTLTTVASASTSTVASDSTTTVEQ
jgi:hypothetical protein